MASSAQNGGSGIQRQELQAAIAKAVELRALHAALLQGGAAAGASPAIIRLPPPAAASPSLSRISHQLSAEDYPVFTPSYEDPLPGFNHIRPENRSLSENWSGIILERATTAQDENDSDSPENENGNFFSSSNSEPQNIFSTSTEHHLLNRGARKNNNHTSLVPLHVPDCVPKSSSRRSSSGDFNNACKPATISKTEPHPVQPQPITKKQNKGQILSWLFHKSGKKKPTTNKPKSNRSALSPNTIESENMSQLLKDWGVFSLETLKKELQEANENRDAALAEVAEMRSSLGELTNKLVNLEAYSEELKKALKQAVHAKGAQSVDRSNLSKRTKSISVARDNSMPVSHEVMVEGFLQVVSEARLSVKQLAKALIQHLGVTDGYDLTERISSLLQPYDITLFDNNINNNRSSKTVQYCLEALLNESLYQDFENCTFRKNGCPRFLDPKRERQENFSSFVSLRNLSWNEVLRKGTKYYSEDFSKFCDQKMGCIVSTLDWSRPWPEPLLQCFFVAAKCIWLLHLLAFSFNPPLVILRVEENRVFDPVYMEEIVLERQRGHVPGQVKIMVMPGFYVHDRVLKCRVLCTDRSV